MNASPWRESAVFVCVLVLVMVLMKKKKKTIAGADVDRNEILFSLYTLYFFC